MKMTETEMRWQVILAVMSTVTPPRDTEEARKYYQRDTEETAAHFATWACTVAEMAVVEFNCREQRLKECEERLGPKEVHHSWVREE